MKRYALGWIGAFALLGLTSCAGYKLGPVGGQIAGARSVQIKFFNNETLEPRLVAAVNHALRHQLQQEGTFRLESEGDLVVTGVLESFTRNGVSYKPGDVLAVQDYSLRLNARIKVTERATGQVLLEREVTGDTIVRVGNDFASGQQRAVPLIAEQLAARATSLIADGPWPGGDSPEN
ncbi:MAG: hypothetical protein CMO74_08165 [Verrucomicrobiales bacterium]|nr:hypothetical protein [Verrucomicrobiales bacterium]|tara:strand:+ start:17340 stop:17873 length:534 start_codon:yes stop_codon:yes gene_type:complete